MTAFLWFWVILGGVLIVAELVVPGAVLMFLGGGAWIVAVALKLGLVNEPLSAFTLWFVTSLGLILSLRSVLQRWMPSESDHHPIDEEAEGEGEIVEVVEDIASDHASGRVRFRGSTWSARALDKPVPAGHKARLMYREQLVWVVMPAEKTEETP